MTYCHISAQIDCENAGWDRAYQRDEEIVERANEICSRFGTWDEALAEAEKQLDKQNQIDAEDCLRALHELY